MYIIGMGFKMRISLLYTVCITLPPPHPPHREKRLISSPVRW